METTFEALFGRPPAVTADAPGRVNLIGEHTDYNDGFVLPIAIPQRTTVALAPRDDRRVRLVTAAVAGTANMAASAYDLGAERRTGAWTDYVAACTATLAAAGHRLCGFDLAISSRVPIGAGLSSSAALEVAVL